MGKTIGVVSLKGGVGKTTTVASLGAAFSDMGKKVLLVDGNLSSPSLGLHLNVIDPEITLHHVLDRKSHAKDAIQELEGLDLLPASIFWKKKINPLLLKDRIKSLKRKYDIILLDSSPSLDDETLAVMLAADEVLVVTTPDHPTLSASIKAAKLARQRGTPISGIIINRAYNKNFEISLPDIEEALDIPVMAVIPHDMNVLRALSEMEPYTRYKSRASGSIEFKKLAATLVGEKYKSWRLQDLFKKITPNRPEINRELFYEEVFGK